LGIALDSFRYALERVGEPREIHEIKSHFGTGADRMLARIVGDPVKGAKAFEYYLQHQASMVDSVRVHKGIRDILEKCQARQMPLGLFTGRHSLDLKIILDAKNLQSFFKVQITDNLLNHSKPAPDGIIAAAHGLGVEPSQTIYVGDSPMDIKAAKAAGAISVAALWDSLVVESEMLAQKPDFMAKTPAQVLEFFELASQ
jgi:HAD superfamily hydrolase (TIGR01509 family)